MSYSDKLRILITLTSGAVHELRFTDVDPFANLLISPIYDYVITEGPIISCYGNPGLISLVNDIGEGSLLDEREDITSYSSLSLRNPDIKLVKFITFPNRYVIPGEPRYSFGLGSDGAVYHLMNHGH